MPACPRYTTISHCAEHEGKERVKSFFSYHVSEHNIFIMVKDIRLNEIASCAWRISCGIAGYSLHSPPAFFATPPTAVSSANYWSASSASGSAETQRRAESTAVPHSIEKELIVAPTQQCLSDVGIMQIKRHAIDSSARGPNRRGCLAPPILPTALDCSKILSFEHPSLWISSRF